MSSERHTTTARFISALALATLVLFGGLTETIHNSRVGHEICPEHGEIVDVAVRHTHWNTASASHAVDVCVQPSDAGPEQHDHCLFATLLGSSGSPWAGSAHRIVVPLGCYVPHVSALAVRAAAISPLAFAPKHSPPARAV